MKNDVCVTDGKSETITSASKLIIQLVSTCIVLLPYWFNWAIMVIIFILYLLWLLLALIKNKLKFAA